MKRLGWMLLLLLGVVAASGLGRYLWVQGEMRLSNGDPLPPELAGRVVPGQYLELEGGRFEPKRAWRPPLDLTKTFEPADASRVTFSHERHFAALGAKATTCETCHRTLDEQKTWESLTRDPTLEPHGETSLGRFCASCHDGKTEIAAIEGANPPKSDVVFTAFGRTGDPSCNRCHAPKDHGQDFTDRHGDIVERSGRRSCADCHRGALGIAPAEIDQARAFYHAQMRLLQNPEDEAAFNVTLPNNFCAYCHGTDLKAWYDD